MKVTDAATAAPSPSRARPIRRRSASAIAPIARPAPARRFRVSVPIPGDVFKMKGQPTNYVKTTADSGNPRVQAFCPKCGSPIYSTTPGEGQQASYMVRVGILAQRDQLAPKKQNWFRSARNWVTQLDSGAQEPEAGVGHRRAGLMARPDRYIAVAI